MRVRRHALQTARPRLAAVVVLAVTMALLAVLASPAHAQMAAGILSKILVRDGGYVELGAVLGMIDQV